MAAPTLSDYRQSTWTDTPFSGTSEATAAITFAAGDLVVVVGCTEDNGSTLATPTATGLLFSSVTSTNTGSNCKAYLWTATAAGSGTSVVSSVLGGGGSPAAGLSAFVFTGSDGIGTPVTFAGSSALTQNLTRAQANSHVVLVMGDWAEVGDVTITVTPTGTSRVAVDVSSRACFYVNSYGDQGSTGTTAYGISSFTGTPKFAGVLVEVKGTAGGGGVTVKPLNLRVMQAVNRAATY